MPATHPTGPRPTPSLPGPDGAEASIRLLLQHGLFISAEALARDELARAAADRHDALHYLLALSLDAQDRHADAAPHYASAMGRQLEDLTAS